MVSLGQAYSDSAIEIIHESASSVVQVVQAVIGTGLLMRQGATFSYFPLSEKYTGSKPVLFVHGHKQRLRSTCMTTLMSLRFYRERSVGRDVDIAAKSWSG